MVFDGPCHFWGLSQDQRSFRADASSFMQLRGSRGGLFGAMWGTRLKPSLAGGALDLATQADVVAEAGRLHQHPVCRTCEQHPCPNHNNVRASREYGDQSIHAQTIITFVFQEHTLTRASMPKP